MSLYHARDHGCRISDAWTFRGMRTVVLENELIRVTVLVDRGSDIVEFRYKPQDLNFLHLAPSGIRNPAQETPPASSTSPYLDYFSGGWNEIIPNGGPSVEYKGAILGQHGEICLIPWQYAILEDTPERVAVRMWVRPLRTPFFIEKTLSMYPGKAVLEIEETLRNEAGESMHLMWGHHIAFGRPFLDEGVHIDSGAQRFITHEKTDIFEPRRFQPETTSNWPNTVADDGTPTDASIIPPYSDIQAQEMAYLTDFQSSWYSITNRKREVGFGVHFDSSVFRYVWYWQQLGGVSNGYPWWGRTHTAALEPWSSYPTDGLNKAIKNGTALQLEPGEEKKVRLCAIAYQSSTEITNISANGDVEQLG